MIQSENLIKLIKNDTQSNLNFYKNLLLESNQDSKELVETASRIRKNLDLGKRKSKNQNQEVSNFSRTINKDLRANRHFTNIENSNLRKEGRTNPKIQIFNQRYVNKFDYGTKKSQKYDNVFSSYNNENMKFQPVSNHISVESTNYDKDSEKKGEQRSKIVRNNIDYDTKIKPLFFMNRYVEYSYQDKGDNLYESGDLFRNLFEKKIIKDQNQELYITKDESVYLDTFKKLLKQMNEEKKEIIQKTFIHSSSREEGKLASDELKNISKYKSYKNEIKSKSSLSEEEKNKKDNEYKTYFLSKIKSYENSTISAVGMNNDTFYDGNNEKEIFSLGKKASEVAFDIDVEAEILKKGKRKAKKEMKKKIRIRGPQVTIFKPPSSNKELQNLDDKYIFDLRNLNLEEKGDEINYNKNNNYTLMKKTSHDYTKKINENDELNLNYLDLNRINAQGNYYKHKLIIKKFTKKDKEIRKPIVFYSNKIAEFQNKSLASLFVELQRYYQDFLFNLENSTYNTLKFLSNPNCQLLEINSLESQKLLNNLYWHPQIQILTIPTSFVASLKIVMDAKNWECFLKTLTLVQDIAVSSPTFEESIVSLFSGINSISIQNIHFINVPYNKKILNALFKHIELFYSMTNESLNFILGSKPDSKIILSNSSEKDFNSFEEPDHPKTKIFLHIQEEKLPIINLSWKKTPNSKLTSVNFEEAIDLRGIYYMLMDMLIKAYKFNNHKLPEVFNKLDLSETVVSDDIGFLVKIITQFKIIKELDISNTKIYSSGKVINSDKFLRKIKLTNDFMKVFNFDEENAFIENTLKEIESFKNDTQEEKNPPPTSLKDEDTSYTFFMGIFPILEKIYAYNTDIKENIARDIYVLFKKLKFFEGFYCSSSSNNNILKNTINTLANIIQNDSSSFCENVFKINNCS